MTSSWKFPRHTTSRRSLLRLPSHEATSATLGAVYPFASDLTFTMSGVLLGRDIAGSPFAYDPFVLYQKGIITNPNMIVFGQVGRGKSALVKSYLWRQVAFGRRSFVLDPKGEYGALAAESGSAPLRLFPGGRLRINPLDAPASESGRRDRLAILSSLSEAAIGRQLSPVERAGLHGALDQSARKRGDLVILPDVVEALLAPDAITASSIGTAPASMARAVRDVALELRRLVHTDLAGMLDGPTTIHDKLAGPVTVIDLSAVYGSQSLGIVMACVMAWIQAVTGISNLPDPGDVAVSDASDPCRAPGGRQCLLVVDEAWALLSDLAIARWLRSSWKLARAYGTANIAVLHRITDLASAGPNGSEQAGLAAGLLADSETRVVFAQPSGELEQATAALGLEPGEASLLPKLGRGVALWKIGARSMLVRHVLATTEHSLTYTDSRMTAQSSPSPDGYAV